MILGKDAAKELYVLCDRNTAWEQIQKVAALWLDEIEGEQHQAWQVERFKMLLIGITLYEQAKGVTVKLSKDILHKGDSNPLFVAMAYTGVTLRENGIDYMAVYPSGRIKIRRHDEDTEWI